ncbi:MAG: hypothetical protein ABIR70_01825 [Bryobacteraceae bacterium]
MRPLVLLLCIATSSFAQQSLHDQIQSLYRDLGEGRLSAQALNDYWNKAKANPAPYVSALRVELSDRDNSPWVLFDGGVRLLNLSSTPLDRRLVTSALRRFDIQALHSASAVGLYYGVVFTLTRLNEDVTLAAFRVLEFPEISLQMWRGIFMHQGEMLAYFLYPTPREYWVDSAVERLSSEMDPTAQRSLLELLWFAQDDFADQEIAAFAKDGKRPPESREFAEELLARQASVSSLNELDVLSSSEDELRARARATVRLYSVSGLADLRKATLKVAAKRKLNGGQ